MLSTKQIHDLYEQYGALIYQRCYHMLGNEPDAKDALQEVFYSALQYRERFQEKAPPIHWLHRITTNCCLGVLRKYNNREGKKINDNLLQEGSYDPSDDTIRRDILVRLLDYFDSKTQAIVVNTFVEGLLQDEIAEVMNISTRTIRKKLNKFYEKAEKIVHSWERASPDRQETGRIK